MVYDILEEAFPPNERRTREGQYAAWERDECYVLVGCDEKQDIISCIIFWYKPEKYNCVFLEHFAVTSHCRGGGIGAGIIRELAGVLKKPMMLEAEPPELSDVAARRVAFYQRLGFHLNPYDYMQPSLQHGQEPVPLKIMTYPEAITFEVFEQCKQVAIQVAYCNNPQIL